jgi:hypothetical protein
MNKTTPLHEQIDRIIEERQSSGFRNHLGASIIGRECARQVWYTFRWFKKVRHAARLLRLFDRGNLEEERFIKWLKQAGVEVLALDPETGKQIRIEDHNGHFGGSLDAMLRDVPGWPRHDEWVLGEFKTYNDKQFQELKKKKVKKAKSEHYGQMQVYMHKKDLPAAFYFAINKNDDEVYTELVMYDRETAEQLIDRAGKIIAANLPPDKINESPAWFGCNWCDYKDICHYGAPAAVNCRTCVHSRPIADAQWICTRYNYVLSEAEQKMGCRDHLVIPNS